MKEYQLIEKKELLLRMQEMVKVNCKKALITMFDTSYSREKFLFNNLEVNLISFISDFKNMNIVKIEYDKSINVYHIDIKINTDTEYKNFYFVNKALYHFHKILINKNINYKHLSFHKL